MARCEICGSAYPKALELTANGETQRFVCMKCAVKSMVSLICSERRRWHPPVSMARRIPLPHPLHLICPATHMTRAVHQASA